MPHKGRFIATATAELACLRQTHVEVCLQIFFFSTDSPRIVDKVSPMGFYIQTAELRTHQTYYFKTARGDESMAYFFFASPPFAMRVSSSLLTLVDSAKRAPRDACVRLGCKL